MTIEDYQLFKENVAEIRFLDTDKQYDISEQFLRKARDDDDAYGVFLACIYLLDSCIAMRDYEGCQTYIYEALRFIDVTQKEDVSHFYLLCGIYYFMTGNIRSAISYNCDTLYLCEDINNDIRTAAAYNNIALIFYNCDDYKEALQYYSKAYDLMVNKSITHIARNMTIILGNLISCYIQINDVEHALQYMEHLSKQHEYHSLYACLQAEISNLQQDKEMTIAYCMKTYELMPKDTLDKHLIYTIHEDIVKIMLQVGNKEQAFDAICRFYKVINTDSTTEKLVILRYYIQYAKTYKVDEILQDLYCHYYELNEKREAIKKETCVQSYHDQLLLDKMIRLNSSLKESAAYDSVTGLKNRNAFEHDIKYLLKNKDITYLSLMMCDVDNFKEHNDSHGHLFGDQILHSLGDLLSQYVKDDFVAYRFGGDEFLCLGINKDKSSMKTYMDQIFTRLKDTTSIKVSAGFTCLKVEDIHNYVDLINIADKALYKAKREGKNRYEYNE